MALRIGSLYVSLAAKTDPFTKGMAKAMQEVDKVSKKVAELGSKLGGLGAMASAAAAGAVAVAAQHNAAVSEQVERQQRIWATVASEVGQAVVPVLRQVSDVLQHMLGIWQHMAPETKQAVTHWAEVGASVLVAAGAFGKLAGLVGSLAGTFGSLITALAPFAGAIFGAVAAGAALFVIAGVIREAWDENLLGIRETVAAVWDWVTARSKQVFNFFREGADKIGEWFGAAFDWIRSTFLQTVELVAQGMEKFGKLIGHPLEGAADFVRDLGGWMAHLTTRNGLAELADDATNAFDFAKRGISKNLDDIKAKINEVVQDIMGGPMGDLVEGKVIVDVSSMSAANTSSPSALGKFGDGSNLSDIYGYFGNRKKIEDEEAKKTAEALKKLQDAAREARDSLISTFISRTGTLGEMLNTAMQGFEAGGPWGAAIAALADLATRSTGFTELVNVTNGVLQSLANAFNSLLKPLPALTAAVGDILTQLFDVLQPAFEIIAEKTADYIPLLEMVAQMLKSFKPVLDFFGQTMKAVSGVIQQVSDLWLHGLFEAFRWLGVVALKIAAGLVSAWNGVLTAFSDVFRALGNVSLLGAHPLGFLLGWADSVDSARGNTDALNAAMEALWGMTWESATAIAEESAERYKGIEAQDKQNQAMKEATASLLNVPDGYKVALARFNAMDATASATIGQASGGFDSLPGSTSGGDTYVTIEGNVYGITDLVTAIEDERSTRYFRKTGLPTAG